MLGLKWLVWLVWLVWPRATRPRKQRPRSMPTKRERKWIGGP